MKHLFLLFSFLVPLLAQCPCDIQNFAVTESPALTVSTATFATPIVVTTSVNHGYATGNIVGIQGALGNTAANGIWRITVGSSTTFTLLGSVGNAAYTANSATAQLGSPIPVFTVCGQMVQRFVNGAVVHDFTGANCVDLMAVMRTLTAAQRMTIIRNIVIDVAKAKFGEN